ncbi:MAG: Ig-like domain-containing protein [Parcubacteria group bacterium]|nr:Ig-like domain-containing protein [Parcubacteria group bacterium]
MCIFLKKFIILFLLGFSSAVSVSAASTNLNVTVDNPECQNGIDDDGDTLIDFPADLQCDSLSDNSEAPPPPPPSSGGGGGADNQPPVIVDFTPKKNAFGVASTTVISMTFDEYLLIQGGTIVIKKSSDNSIFDTIPVTSSRVTLTAQRILSLQPHALFQEGASYYIELPAGMVHDFAGNAFSGLSGSSGWKFTIEDNTPPAIINISVILDANTATVSWNTDEPALSIFFWGTTTAYFTGSGLDPEYSTTHMAVFGDLSPESLYSYNIAAKDSLGNTRSVNGTFTTLAQTNQIPPANPGDFTASPDTNFFALTWENPDNGAFEAVRVVRKEDGYPADPYDGDSVYEGTGEETYDTNVLFGKRYYYAIFARDGNGAYSSGALASALLESPESSLTEEEPKLVPQTTPSIPVPVSDKPIIFAPRFSDLDFFEIGGAVKALSVSEDTVYLDSGKDLKISLPKSLLPARTESAVLTIRNFLGIGQDSSFLLRENSEHTANEGVISLFSREGKYPVDIAISDTEGGLIAEVRGFFDMKSYFTPAFLSVIPPVGALLEFFDSAFSHAGSLPMFALFLLLFVCLFLFGLFLRKRKRNNPKGYGNGEK